MSNFLMREVALREVQGVGLIKPGMIPFTENGPVWVNVVAESDKFLAV